jgi:hypothetical protein
MERCPQVDDETLALMVRLAQRVQRRERVDQGVVVDGEPGCRLPRRRHRLVVEKHQRAAERLGPGPASGFAEQSLGGGPE